MSASSSNNMTGLLLALVTAVMWGLLPLALMSVLQLMDSYTITMYRFLFAAVFVSFILYNNKNIPTAIFKNKGLFKRLFFAAIFLSLNYILYLSSLYFVPAETAQMLIQMAPFMMLIGSVVFLKESFTRGQMVGSVVLISGLLLFFNQQFSQAGDIANDDFITGFIIMLGASSTWAIYAILQKKMLNHFSSNQIMWFIYLFSSLFFLPLSAPADIGSLNIVALLLLLFCCANTLVAYGTFAKAMEYWPASKVSAVLAITPLLTVLFATIAESIWPHLFSAQELNGLAYIGACLVVTGSMLTALGNKILTKEKFRSLKRMVRL
ncbi:DMT family transporter [Thalassotalea sp. HSM 43]|uniref:DMT family transporter n=1 Tax=Thalassotalea sp. HSM 43 TaxID=2552945 RepID=UPI001081D143|nr:DMT family transporter [Thalassotalea sp. HSM 43]QBY05227.1 DMT family transporter [Thalassotalea sp. HSM 43]